jgi:hypothetical protein
MGKGIGCIWLRLVGSIDGQRGKPFDAARKGTLNILSCCTIHTNWGYAIHLYFNTDTYNRFNLKTEIKTAHIMGKLIPYIGIQSFNTSCNGQGKKFY